MQAAIWLIAALQAAGTWERTTTAQRAVDPFEAIDPRSTRVGVLASTAKVAILRETPGLLAISLADGKEAWSVEHRGDVLRFGETLLLKGSSSRDPLRILDLETGQASAIEPPKKAEVVPSGGSFYFVQDQLLQRADLRGAVQWEWKSPDRRLRPMPQEFKDVVIVSTNEALIGLGHDGKELWTLPHPTGKDGKPSVRFSATSTDAGIVFERGDNTLEVLDPKTGKILRSASHKKSGGWEIGFGGGLGTASGDSIAWNASVSKTTANSSESTYHGLVFNAAAGKFSEIPYSTHRIIAASGSYFVFDAGWAKENNKSLVGLDGKGGSWKAPGDSFIAYGTTDGFVGRPILDGKSMALEIRHASGSVVGKVPIGSAAWTADLFKPLVGAGKGRHLAFKPCGDLFLLHVDDELRVIDTKARVLKKVPLPAASGEIAWGSRARDTAIVQLASGRMLGIRLGL
jgi:hypothetical protein